jgi:hypothetical protein
VITAGVGANDVFAHGSGAHVSVTYASITATGEAAHGAMTSGGGSITLRDVHISTAGGRSVPLATDRGGGTVSVTGGSMRSTGTTSPAICSTGKW